MKIFVSYSFRPENRWVTDYVIPLLECFGHEPLTGRILDAGALDQEVKSKIQQCRRVLCFVTRAKPRHDHKGVVEGYDPPDWVRDELMMARGASKEALEFRERGVNYGGAAPLHGYAEFDSTEIPKLMLDLAHRVSEWPVGPLQLRLSVPEQHRADVQRAANAQTLKARCAVFDETGQEQSAEELTVRFRDDQLIVPFWIKPNPNLSIEIEVILGAQRLACRGISPTVRDARLQQV